MTDIAQPLTLPCGVTLKNRMCKAALTEGLADAHNRATDGHVQLYRRWAHGGFGVVLTGNVQVDRRYLERSGNVAVDDNGGLDELAAFAEAGGANDCALWMQIGHAGRQVTKFINPVPAGPSAVPMSLGDTFCTPRALSEEDILNAIHRFTVVADAAKQTGFGGVQLHSAHGYLLSSFLSPLANQRTDRWGGSLENRARMLLETLRAVRRTVGADYPIGIKLNSSDFQKDGFTHDDSLQVIEWLNEEGLDLLELSGGNYESPSMMGKRESTQKREAFFLDFAERACRVAKMPLMVTGGFRNRSAMDAALASGACQMVGLGRPSITDPELAEHLLSDADASAIDWENRLEPANLAIHWYYIQLLRLARGEEVDLELDPRQTSKEYLQIEVEAAAALQGRSL